MNFLSAIWKFTQSIYSGLILHSLFINQWSYLYSTGYENWKSLPLHTIIFNWYSALLTIILLVLFFPFSESTIFLSCFSPLCLFLQLIYWLSIRCHRLNSNTSGIYWASDRFGRFTFFFHSSLFSLFFLFLSFPSPHFTRLRSNFSIYLWVRYEIGEHKSYNVCGSRLFFCIEFVGYTVCGSRLYIFLNLSTLVRDFVSHNCILFEIVDHNSRARWYDIQLVVQKKMKVRLPSQS